MKPTDPTPEEYVKWIDAMIKVAIAFDTTHNLSKFILTELRDNSTTEINRMFFNECLTKLKELC